MELREFGVGQPPTLHTTSTSCPCRCYSYAHGRDGYLAALSVRKGAVGFATLRSGGIAMLGSWQQKIIECLELGPISIEALMLRLGAHSRERRDKVHLSLRRLQDQGTIR